MSIVAKLGGKVMTKKDVQLNIRMTRELKEKIEASAKANNRTTNAEAITLIEASLNDSTSQKLDLWTKTKISENSIPGKEFNDEEMKEIFTESYRDIVDEILKENMDKIMSRASDKLVSLITKDLHKKD